MVAVPAPPTGRWIRLTEGMRVTGARLVVSDPTRAASLPPYVRDLRAVSDVSVDERGVLWVDAVPEAVWYRMADGLPARDGDVQTWPGDAAWVEYVPPGRTWRELYDLAE
jgi:hypothetical protein